MCIRDRIKRNSERLLSLINDIIRLSELDHSEMPRQYENFDLYEFVKDCAESLQVNACLLYTSRCV